MGPMIPLVAWDEVLGGLERGQRGYYLDCGDFWSIVLVDPCMACDMMKAEAFDRYGPDVTCYFNRDASTMFETRFKPAMIEGKGGQNVAA